MGGERLEQVGAREDGEGAAGVGDQKDDRTPEVVGAVVEGEAALRDGQPLPKLAEQLVGGERHDIELGEDAVQVGGKLLAHPEGVLAARHEQVDGAVVCALVVHLEPLLEGRRERPRSHAVERRRRVVPFALQLSEDDGHVVQVVSHRVAHRQWHGLDDGIAVELQQPHTEGSLLRLRCTAKERGGVGRRRGAGWA